MAQALQILHDLGVKRNAGFRAFLERLELLFSGDVDAIAAGGCRGRFDVPQNAVHLPDAALVESIRPTPRGVGSLLSRLAKYCHL